MIHIAEKDAVCDKLFHGKDHLQGQMLFHNGEKNYTLENSF